MIYAIAWWTLEREQPKLFAVCHITEAENLMLLLRGKPHLKFICPAVGSAIMILPPGCVLACACLYVRACERSLTPFVTEGGVFVCLYTAFIFYVTVCVFYVVPYIPIHLSIFLSVLLQYYCIVFIEVCAYIYIYILFKHSHVPAMFFCP